MKDKTGSTNGFQVINTQGGLETKRGGSKTTKGKFKKGR